LPRKLAALLDEADAGIALVDWIVIRDAWATCHPTWRWEEQVVLVQVPTVTSISSQAPVGERAPLDLPESLTATRHDARRW
jgi:hypothetical protein